MLSSKAVTCLPSAVRPAYDLAHKFLAVLTGQICYIERESELLQSFVVPCHHGITSENMGGTCPPFAVGLLMTHLTKTKSFYERDLWNGFQSLMSL